MFIHVEVSETFGQTYMKDVSIPSEEAETNYDFLYPF